MGKSLKYVLPVILILLLGFSMSRSSELATGDCDFVERALRDAKAIKVGMTRAQLEKNFSTEGGLSSRRSRTYVYRDCGYIKMDVKFQPVEAPDAITDSPTDKISAVSRPYLANRIFD